MNIENPALLLANELERLNNELNDKTFEDFIKNYFESEIQDVPNNDPVTIRRIFSNRYWYKLKSLEDQLNELYSTETNERRKKNYREFLGHLYQSLTVIERFTIDRFNLSYLQKTGNGIVEAMETSIDTAIQSAYRLEHLGETSIKFNENKKLVINFFIEKISNFKNEILNSILNDDLKEKLINLLSEMEELLRTDFINESKLKEKSKDFYIYLSEEKDNPNNTEADRDYLSDLFIQWREWFFTGTKFLLDKSASPLITLGLQKALQLSSGN